MLSRIVRNVIPDCEECYPGLYGMLSRIVGMLSRIVRNAIPDCTECYPGLCGMLSRIVRNVIPDCEECYPGSREMQSGFTWHVSRLRRMQFRYHPDTLAGRPIC